MISKRMSKSIKLIALAFCVLTTLILSSAVVCADETCFTDTHEHWAEGAINRWKDAGFINGYPDGSFKPDALVTRAEAAKIITLAFGLKDSKELHYPDVNPNDWYYSYVATADQYMPSYSPYESGRPYTDPYIDNNNTLNKGFLPQQADLRMFLAETLSILKAQREGVTLQFPEYPVIQRELSENFIDDHFAEHLVDPRGHLVGNKVRMEQYCWAAWKMGIFEGDDNHWFGPMEPVTRAALVVTIDRILTPEKSAQQTAEQ